MDKMKIFIFTSVHIWKDTRVFIKEAVSLAKKFDVELHAPADFKYKEIKNVKVYGLPIWKTQKDRKITREIIRERLKKSDADVFHFHDPELIPTGLYLKLKNKTVIYDVHENISKQVLTKEWIAKPVRRLVSSGIFLFEKFSSVFFDRIITVIPSIKESFLPFNKKVDIIYNYPMLQKFEVDYEKKDIDAIYVGSVTRIRNVFNMIKAAEVVKKSKPDVVFKIVGPIEDELKKEVNEYITQKDLRNNVIITGRMDYNIMVQELIRSKIGLGVILPQKNLIDSVSTKMFEYMMFRLYIVASDFPLWEKLIDKIQCGVTVDPTDPQAIANAVIEALNNKKMLQEKSQNAYKYIEKEYNWGIEEKKLIEIYKGLKKGN